LAVPDLGPLADDRVRFAEEQDNAALHCRVEDLPEILFGLPDVLAHDTRQVVPEKGKVQVVPITSATMVLPVPLGPEKSAVIPYISRMPAGFAFIVYPL